MTCIALGCVAAFASYGQQGEAAAPFRQEGIASWYGAEFDGKPTASGEAFDSKLLTAAHPTLGFGTILKVTNTQNGKMATVRVNDRGPFVPARIIDVSRAAAELLDMLTTGTAPVVIEAVPGEALASSPAAASGSAIVPVPQAMPPAAQTATPASQFPVAAAIPAPAAPGPAKILPGPVNPASGKRYRLQVGSYKSTKYASDAFDRLKKAGLPAAYERNENNYRVVVPEAAASDLERLAAVLGAAGFKEVLAREIP